MGSGQRGRIQGPWQVVQVVGVVFFGGFSQGAECSGSRSKLMALDAFEGCTAGGEWKLGDPSGGLGSRPATLTLGRTECGATGFWQNK